MNLLEATQRIMAANPGRSVSVEAVLRGYNFYAGSGRLIRPEFDICVHYDAPDDEGRRFPTCEHFTAPTLERVVELAEIGSKHPITPALPEQASEAADCVVALATEAKPLPAAC